MGKKFDFTDEIVEKIRTMALLDVALEDIAAMAGCSVQTLINREEIHEMILECKGKARADAQAMAYGMAIGGHADMLKSYLRTHCKEWKEEQSAPTNIIVNIDEETRQKIVDACAKMKRIKDANDRGRTIED
jgi:hypothetical protein